MPEVFSHLCNNMSFTDLEAEVTEVAPTKGPTSSDIGNQDDDGHDYRWPTRSPLQPDNGDSLPYPNRTISNPNSGSGNEGEEPDHRWPTRPPITPREPLVQSSLGPDLDQTEDEQDSGWPTRSPIAADNEDSKPYTNKTISTPNSDNSQEDGEPDHRWPTRAPITPDFPLVQSSSGPVLDQTDNEQDNRWPTRAPITESEAQVTASPSDDYDFDTWGAGRPQIQGTEEPFYYDYYNYYDDTRADSRLEQSKQSNPWLRRRMLRRSLK